MPGMDGFEATRSIRAQYPGTQVVILTAYEELLTDSAESVGAFAYLVKGCSAALGPKVFSIAYFGVLPSSTLTMAGARGGSQYAPSGLPGKGENMHQVRRLGVLGTLIAGVLAFGMVAALASASGQGQTPLSASLGFNAQADLSGQLDYVADPNGPNAGFRAHCDGYTFYAQGTTKNGYPHVLVTATCTDQNGATIYLKAGFTDRGEPGTNDSLCVLWSYTNPPTEANAYIHDMGKILSGNIQILPNDPSTGQPDAQMLSA